VPEDERAARITGQMKVRARRAMGSIDLDVSDEAGLGGRVRHFRASI
jgi:hypothetical protein